MTNADIAAVLGRLVQLMELLGIDSFRVSAIARAARSIESLATDLATIARAEHGRNRLLELDGIGPKIADKIIELCTTGRLSELDELNAQVPPGLIPLLQIPNCGPKTVRLFWKEAGVTDLASLVGIIDDGRILTLPRMGAKSVQRLKDSIALLAQGVERLHLGPAWALAQRVCDELRSLPGVREVAAAGSLRRGKESVGDIDLLVSCDARSAPAVGERFRTLAGVSAVLAAGATKSAVRMALAGDPRWEGDHAASTTRTVQVDLRVIAPAQYGAALMYFTGSKEHNVLLRQRALDRGMTLNEYGLFPEDPKLKHDKPPQQRGVRAVAGATEQEIYAALGLGWVPPELREEGVDPGTASRPGLIELADIRAELHAHTSASDGVMSIVELATRAKARGFHTIAVTDHSQSSAIAGGLKPARLREHIAAIHAARGEVEGITILAGSEVDILADGRLDYDDDLLAQLDIVVASPHAALTQDPASATARLLRAIKHPLVHILGHPTGRLILRRKGLEPNMGEVFAAAKEHNVALEINAHWMRLDLRDTHVRGALDAGCLLAINCDVHHPGDFDNLRFGVMTARRGGLRPAACINTWEAKRLHAWLKDKRD